MEEADLEWENTFHVDTTWSFPPDSKDIEDVELEWNQYLPDDKHILNQDSMDINSSNDITSGSRGWKWDPGEIASEPEDRRSLSLHESDDGGSVDGSSISTTSVTTYDSCWTFWSTASVIKTRSEQNYISSFDDLSLHTKRVLERVRQFNHSKQFESNEEPASLVVDVTTTINSRHSQKEPDLPAVQRGELCEHWLQTLEHKSTDLIDMEPELDTEMNSASSDHLGNISIIEDTEVESLYASAPTSPVLSFTSGIHQVNTGNLITGALSEDLTPLHDALANLPSIAWVHRYYVLAFLDEAIGDHISGFESLIGDALKMTDHTAHALDPPSPPAKEPDNALKRTASDSVVDRYSVHMSPARPRSVVTQRSSLENHETTSNESCGESSVELGHMVSDCKKRNQDSCGFAAIKKLSQKGSQICEFSPLTSQHDITRDGVLSCGEERVSQPLSESVHAEGEHFTQTEEIVNSDEGNKLDSVNILLGDIIHGVLSSDYEHTDDDSQPMYVSDCLVQLSIDREDETHTNTDSIQVDKLSTCDIQSEDVQTDDIQSEEAHVDDIQSEDVKTGDIITENVQKIDIQSEDVQMSNIQSEDVQMDDIQSAEVQTKDLQSEDAKISVIQFEDVHAVHNQSGDVQMDYIQSEDSRKDATQPEDICSDFIKSEDIGFEYIQSDIRMDDIQSAGYNADDFQPNDIPNEPISGGDINTQGTLTEDTHVKPANPRYGDIQIEEISFVNIQTEGITVGNIHSENIPSNDIQSEGITVGNIHSENIPSYDIQSQGITVGTIQSENIPSNDIQSEDYASYDIQQELICNEYIHSGSGAKTTPGPSPHLNVSTDLEISGTEEFAPKAPTETLLRHYEPMPTTLAQDGPGQTILGQGEPTKNSGQESFTETTLNSTLNQDYITTVIHEASRQASLGREFMTETIPVQKSDTGGYHSIAMAMSSLGDEAFTETTISQDTSNTVAEEEPTKSPVNIESLQGVPQHSLEGGDFNKALGEQSSDIIRETIDQAVMRFKEVTAKKPEQPFVRDGVSVFGDENAKANQSQDLMKSSIEIASSSLEKKKHGADTVDHSAEKMEDSDGKVHHPADTTTPHRTLPSKLIRRPIQLVKRSMQIMDQPKAISEQTMKIEKLPVSNVKQKMNMSEQSIATDKMQMDFVKEPMGVVKQPIGVPKNSICILKKPTDILRQPIDIAKQHMGNEKQPRDILKEPITCLKRPMTIVKRPQNISKQPMDIMEDSKDIVKQPKYTVEQSDDNQKRSTGFEKQPTKIPKQPMVILSKPAGILKKPINISKRPVYIEEQAMDIVEQAVDSGYPSHTVSDIVITHSSGPSYRSPEERRGGGGCSHFKGGLSKIPTPVNERRRETDRSSSNGRSSAPGTRSSKNCTQPLELRRADNIRMPSYIALDKELNTKDVKEETRKHHKESSNASRHPKPTRVDSTTSDSLGMRPRHTLPVPTASLQDHQQKRVEWVTEDRHSIATDKCGDEGTEKPRKRTLRRGNVYSTTVIGQMKTTFN